MDSAVQAAPFHDSASVAVTLPEASWPTATQLVALAQDTPVRVLFVLLGLAVAETVQVLPFTAGAHPAMLGSFTLMQFPDPADRDVVYLEAETGALYLEKPEDVRRYSLMIDYLRAQALGPAESRALIARMAEHTPD